MLLPPRCSRVRRQAGGIEIYGHPMALAVSDVMWWVFRHSLVMMFWLKYQCGGVSVGYNYKILSLAREKGKNPKRFEPQYCCKLPPLRHKNMWWKNENVLIISFLRLYWSTQKVARGLLIKHYDAIVYERADSRSGQLSGKHSGGFSCKRSRIIPWRVGRDAE